MTEYMIHYQQVVNGQVHSGYTFVEFDRVQAERVANKCRKSGYDVVIWTRNNTTEEWRICENP